MVAVWEKYFRTSRGRKHVCGCEEMGEAKFPAHFRAKHLLRRQDGGSFKVEVGASGSRNPKPNSRKTVGGRVQKTESKGKSMEFLESFQDS